MGVYQNVPWKKTDQAYDRQWMLTHEVFWQYPLVTSSQLGVVRPFGGLDLKFGGFSQRLMSQPPWLFYNLYTGSDISSDVVVLEF